MKVSGKHGLNVHNGSWLLFMIAFPLLCSISQAHRTVCVPGHNNEYGCSHNGVEADFLVEYGTNRKLNCLRKWSKARKKDHSKDLSHLVLLINDKVVDSNSIKAVDGDIMLQLPFAQLSPSTYTYECRLKFDDTDLGPYEVLMHGAITVGLKPEKPPIVNCVSHNWESLLCTWEPKPNAIPTRFSARLESEDPGTGDLSIACPSFPTKSNTLPNRCLWDASTNPPYKETNQNYRLVLNAENVLGKDIFIYSFNHWKQVMPSRPVNLSVSNETYSSALLHWIVPKRMQNFPPGLHHRVSYQSQSDDPGTWHTIDVTNATNAAEIYLNLPNLEYAHTLYNVRVSMKSSIAVDESAWSEFSNVTFKTAPAPLSLPTDVGSFEIVDNRENRDIYIYWRTIPGAPKNEDNFPYEVVLVEKDGRRLDLKPDEITETYAKFTGISFNNISLEISAANNAAADIPISTVYIPSQVEIPQKPLVSTKIAFDGGIYELSWNSSTNQDSTDYTIFWCESTEDRPYKCSENLDWVHVPGNTNMYNVTVPDANKVYRFAIAANTAQASSGMEWFSNRTVRSDVLGKVGPIRINRVESGLIEVEWDLEDSDHLGVFKGFNVYYCPILLTHNCEGPTLNTTVGADPHQKYGVALHVKPNTTYKLIVAAFSLNAEGLNSDPLYITTPEVVLDPYPTTTMPADAVDKLDSKLNDLLTQISTMNLTMNAFKDKLDFLLEENSQLRQNLTYCCFRTSSIEQEIKFN